ncbi:hypothetical protein LINGRAHAP2_LOCUS18517 [Linum grandiflorum]
MMNSLSQSSLFQISSAKFTVVPNKLPSSQKQLPLSVACSCSKSPASSNGFPKSLVATTAAVALLLSATPAKAGLMSGFSGIESVPGPELPKMDFLTRFNVYVADENQKKYAEDDARFKSSPILKELLEKSKLNQEKNKKEIQDKYCIRGAEWGVGDCSAEGMTPQQKDEFIAMLKQKAGIKE